MGRRTEVVDARLEPDEYLDGAVYTVRWTAAAESHLRALLGDDINLLDPGRYYGDAGRSEARLVVEIAVLVRP